MLISEKDSQMALIEMSGAKTQPQIEKLNQLNCDRFKIKQRMKIEVRN